MMKAGFLAMSQRRLTIFSVFALAWLAFITVPYLRAAMVPLTQRGYLGIRQVGPGLGVAIGLASAGLAGGFIVGAMRQLWLSKLY